MTLKIEVTSTEREVFVKFNGITHFRVDRRAGLDSTPFLNEWKVQDP